MNIYTFLADCILVLHFCYLLFTVGGAAVILAGGLLGWRMIRNRLFRLLHLGSVVFVALEVLVGMWCPLTIWEYRLRILGGQHADGDIRFIGRIIRSIMFFDFPGWFFLLLYIGFAGLVAALFVIFPPQKNRS